MMSLAEFGAACGVSMTFTVRVVNRPSRSPEAQLTDPVSVDPFLDLDGLEDGRAW